MSDNPPLPFGLGLLSKEQRQDAFKKVSALDSRYAGMTPEEVEEQSLAGGELLKQIRALMFENGWPMHQAEFAVISDAKNAELVAKAKVPVAAITLVYSRRMTSLTRTDWQKPE